LEAIAKTTSRRLRFLDIPACRIDGLEVAAARPRQRTPADADRVVTAYNQYAIDAFDRGAVDMWQADRSGTPLRRRLRRVKSRIGSIASMRHALAAIIEQFFARKYRTRPQEPPLAWITASVGKETRGDTGRMSPTSSRRKYTLVVTAAGEAADTPSRYATCSTRWIQSSQTDPPIHDRGNMKAYCRDSLVMIRGGGR